MAFFSYCFGLKPNLTKSEIMGIGVLKEVQVTLLCGMRSIDVSNDMLNILGTHVSCNKKLKKENTVTSIQRVLKI